MVRQISLPPSSTTSSSYDREDGGDIGTTNAIPGVVLGGEIAEVGPPPTTVVEAAAAVITADPDSPGARDRLPSESTIHRQKAGVVCCCVLSWV